MAASEHESATAFASVDEVLSEMRARGGRATVSRRALLEVLFTAHAHLTAEELATEMQARYPEVHLSTVYRNLEELEALGVVVHSHLGHGPATYQLSEHAHGHLICESCGATIEAPHDVFEQFATTTRDRFGFEIDPHHFAILGRCAACVAADR
jgi:Fe2+ or Zn2+ uptake regulation protein